MNDKRVLRFARLWVLNELSRETETYDTSWIKLHLDVSQVESDIHEFLLEVPQWFSIFNLKPWKSEKDNNVILYHNDKGSSFPELKIYMKFFKHETDNYMGLYTQDGKRWWWRCLRINKNYQWDTIGAGRHCPRQI